MPFALDQFFLPPLFEKSTMGIFMTEAKNFVIIIFFLAASKVVVSAPQNEANDHAPQDGNLDNAEQQVSEDTSANLDRLNLIRKQRDRCFKNYRDLENERLFCQNHLEQMIQTVVELENYVQDLLAIMVSKDLEIKSYRKMLEASETRMLLEG